MAEKYDGIFTAAGIHPHASGSATKEDISEVKKLARHPKVVAIGEIGLDFHRDYSPRESQFEVIGQQLELAAEIDLPVIIHSRDSHPEMLELLSEWVSRYPAHGRNGHGVIHCFAGDKETAAKFIELGFHISFGAYIGYPKPNTSAGTVKSIPLDRVMVETDCPFLSPQKYRSKRNEPAYIPLITQTLAKIRQELFEVTARATTANAARLFGW